MKNHTGGTHHNDQAEQSCRSACTLITHGNGERSNIASWGLVFLTTTKEPPIGSPRRESRSPDKSIDTRLPFQSRVVYVLRKPWDPRKMLSHAPALHAPKLADSHLLSLPLACSIGANLWQTIYIFKPGTSGRSETQKQAPRGVIEAYLDVEGVEADQPVAVDDIADLLRQLVESLVPSSSPPATVAITSSAATATATVISSAGCLRLTAILAVALASSPGLAAAFATSALIVLLFVVFCSVQGFSGVRRGVEVGQELPHVLALREELEVEREGAHLLDEVHLEKTHAHEGYKKNAGGPVCCK